jgi:glycosyltransferase involved in cell wall biosynthesis
MTMSKNILFYTPNISANIELIGGVETCTLATVKQLRDGRFNPIVLAHTAGQFVDELRDAGILTETIPIGKDLGNLSRNRIFANPLSLITGISELPNLIDRVVELLHRLDIKLVHCNHPYAFIIGGLAARRAGLPCIWHFHEIWTPGLLKSFYLLAARFLADQIITIAEYEAMTFPKRAKLPPICIIYNGFDFDEFRQSRDSDPLKVRKEFGLEPESFLVGYVSHLAPYKGQTTFLQAMARVVEQYPAVQALVVGGPRKSCEHYPFELRELVAKLGLSKNTIFTGARLDIADVMSALDIFACVSENEEFNRVMVEAMCLGKPTIISDLRGGSIVVQDGLTGLLVPPKDPDSLARAILMLIGNNDLRKELGVAGQKHVEKTFSISKIAQDYEKLYELIIERFNDNGKP